MDPIGKALLDAGWKFRRDPMPLKVLVPGKMSQVRAALATCAIEGNQFAIDALETIRRVEAGEPVGDIYVDRLNDFMASQNEA